MRALPNKLRFVQWLFPGSPRICTLNFLLCIIQFCCICALFGQSVRRVLFYTVYSGVISSTPVNFEWLFSFAFFFNLVRVFRHAASSSASLLPCPSVFAPLFS